MRTYLELVRVPGVLRVTVSQLVARFPLGMLSLAVLLHVRHASGSYALAGLVVASVSVGEAVAMPLVSRSVGALGIRPPVLVAALLNATGMLLLAFGPPQPVLMVALGAVIGASVPPLMPVVRALYPRLVPRRTVPALFALDTSAQELIWITGPVVATLLSGAVSTQAPLVLAALVTLGGTVWFLLAPHIAGVRLPRSRTRPGTVLLTRSVRLAAATSFALIASFAALEIALVARFDGHGILAGLAIAVSSLGSLIGGIAFGHRSFGTRSLAAVLGGVAVATAAAGLVPGIPLLYGVLFLSGLGFAPSLAALYAMVSSALPETATPEAFGWLNTAGLVGGATGTAVAGVLGDALGPGDPFVAATAASVVAALLPLSPGLRPAREHTAGDEPRA
ncbi:Predicted arabinose efflux permease, MFS family [Leifsonia sp. 98AMF]|uniref:MFS transporter n=1 Tax=unclassified Leifsonia TaxID=2663824 RepID=UPI00087BC89C|nr:MULTISPECIES: MFS transporter [unclassified Leifsonia]SDH74235.1 Predicted arabinose efflux permease, MFS family [Leifsonia sp. 197AMF]SDJ47794.1 Predicted arabinose efflux permease, MFS family [Leifsonia sp. 466MF]SDK27525.1 Predicted arabinose efflux permease, MFS family [Leifsonia sp. 157MF]SDN67586.1 Predicted arabinose efflux permease, MFS family [Leifsonia sp. 509MF]SEN40795.1 Predicted arabinose efflux permease, MFS family [Leifsonia sp. 467MF]